MKVFIYSCLLSLSLIHYRWLFPWLWEEGFICTIHPCKQPGRVILSCPSIPGYFPHPLTRLETSWPSFGPSTTTLLSASVPLHMLSLFLVGLGFLSCMQTLWSSAAVSFLQKSLCLNSQMRSSLYLNTFVGFTLYYLLPKRKWIDIVDFTRNVFHSKHLCSRELPVFFSLWQPHPHCHRDEDTIPSRTQWAGPHDPCLRTTPHAKGVFIFSGPGATWWNSREDF